MSAAGLYKGYNYVALTAEEVDTIDAFCPMPAPFKLSKVIDLAQSGEIVGAPAGTVGPDALTNDAKTKVIVSSTVKKLPAPNGADQLANVLYLCSIPVDAIIIGCNVISDTATAASDATNAYLINLKNVTQNELLNATGVSTADGELSTTSPIDIVMEQNNSITANDQLALYVDILDDGGGPTDLSTATLRVEIYWKPA